MINLDAIPEDQISAVHALKGHTLKTGWKVIELAKAKPGSTGGNFSVCYIVEKDGEIGFLKALNILSFLRDDDESGLLEAQAEMLNTFVFEKELLERCTNKNFSKVSKLLEASKENIKGFLIPNVYYMVFEKADGDVRNHLNFTKLVDISWKLRSLHNIATGLRQLHSIEISHQDVKPSNVFVFDSITSKLGDLGRSLCGNVNGPHSESNFSGDPRYAPPEVWHKFVLPEWREKVFAIDCFLLGSMATFYFTLQNMTALLSQNMDSNINVLSLPFEEALPYWIEAFDNSIKTIEEQLTEFDDRDKLLSAIKMLCHPDPRRRGHHKNSGQTHGNKYELERFVELFNLLARRAENKLIK